MTQRTEDSGFTREERSVLARYFTNLDGPVFALVNLPEVVKGALFARYSRSEKSLRRLFLDEFWHSTAPGSSSEKLLAGVEREDEREFDEVGAARAQALYDRIFTDFGDDSVAQLGGAHVACEGVSNVVTKVLERGRLMAYLEQSTRYLRYDRKVGGRYRYRVPPEFEADPEASDTFRRVCDDLFKGYSALFPKVWSHMEARFPQTPGEPDGVYRAALRAKVCDVLRGLLPAASCSNVGIFGSGQAFERLLLRLFSSPYAEARELGEAMLQELKKVIPSFVRRVEIEDRGVAWIEYLRETRESSARAAGALAGEEHRRSVDGLPEPFPATGPEVDLVDFDTEGERKIAAAILFEHGGVSTRRAEEIARKLDEVTLAEIFRTYVGQRRNRRHLPGRAFESTSYTFDIVSDYGSFRDLQRHRILTIEWQRLQPHLGYVVPEAIREVGHGESWRAAMEKASEAFEELSSVSEHAASYVLPMAFRLRYRMQLNAREAVYMIELRTSPQAHPEYRAVCERMADAIRDIAGHRNVYEAMQFKGSAAETLERREAELRAHARRSSPQ